MPDMSTARDQRTPLAWRLAHLWALTALVVAWPVYHLLASYPEFFHIRRSTPGDVLFLVTVLSVVVPVVLMIVVMAATLLNRRLGSALQLFLVGVLVACNTLLAAHDSLGGHGAVLLAGGIGLAAAFAYHRWVQVRSFTSWLAPAIVVIPLLFLVNPGIRDVWDPSPPEVSTGAQGLNETPIVFIVFDEFPVTAILDEDGTIAAERFPGFARLAAGSTWFPAATTVAASTALALPAILTGRYPRQFRAPHLGEYPDNLFTWLAASHELNVQEAVTALCQGKHCPETVRLTDQYRRRALLADVSAVWLNLVFGDLLPWRLPPIDQSWKNFWGEDAGEPGMYHDRLAQLDGYLDSIRASTRPRLDFLHINFPHVPYEYFPSGRRYLDGWQMPGLDAVTHFWSGTDEQRERAYRRLILQLGVVDGWIDRLIQRLQDHGLWDRAILVVTADHGASFIAGTGRRDFPDLQSLDQQILAVPLFIRAPGLATGKVDSGNAETVDILPTISAATGSRPGWAMDGQDLAVGRADERKLAWHNYREMTRRETSVGQVLAPSRFGFRDGWFTRDRHEHAIDRVGPRPDWIGREMGEFAPGTASGVELDLDRPLPSGVSLDANSILPAHVSGHVTWDRAGPIELAFTLNGVIAAVTRLNPGDEDGRFSVVLPERLFQAGQNRAAIHVVDDTATGPARLLALSTVNDAEGALWQLSGDNLTRPGRHLSPAGDAIEGEWKTTRAGHASVELIGWVIDAEEKRTVERVLVFSGDRLVFSGRTNKLAGETNRFGVLLNLGFHAVVPLDMVDQTGALRVFAVSQAGQYRELAPPKARVNQSPPGDQ